MTTLTLLQRGTDQTPDAFDAGVPGKGPTDLLAQAHSLALRTARAELGQHAHDGIDAEDVAQEVVLRFADKDVAALDNWQAWVTRVTQTLARDTLRARRRHGHEPVGGYPGDSRGLPGPDRGRRPWARASGGS